MVRFVQTHQDRTSFIQIKLYSETQVNRTRNAMLFRLIITESQTMSIEKPTLLENNGKYWKLIFTVPAQWSGFSGIWKFYFPVSGNHS